MITNASLGAVAGKRGKTLRFGAIFDIPGFGSNAFHNIPASTRSFVSPVHFRFIANRDN